MNLKRLRQLFCGHVFVTVIDRYPETEWIDSGEDSNVLFSKGRLKVRCNTCGCLHLTRHRDFIYKPKEKPSWA